MAKDAEIRTARPCVGMADTEAYDVPPNAYLTLRGFQLRRGFPWTEKALLAYTTSEIRTSERVRAYKRWKRPDDTTKNYAICDGGLWDVVSASSFTLLSTIAPGGTASRSGNTVTISSIPNGTLVGVARVGDVFYYDADGKDAGGTVSAVAAGTLTLSSYGGSATSGAFTIWRKLTDQETYIVAAGGRLFISDGSGPLHEYGPDELGSSTYAFRQTGVPKPPLQPVMAVSAGGGLGAGDYIYYIALESKRGEIGNALQMRTITASASDKNTMTSMPEAVESPRADYYRIYRSKVGKKSGFFFLTNNIVEKSTGISSQVITLAKGGLTASAHKYRRVKFLTTGNSYELADNAAGNLTVKTGLDISGESVTDDLYIFGGYSIVTIQAASATFVDYSTDADLDIFNKAPLDNDVPPSGLKHLVAFQGGGRIGGFVGSLFYASGRSTTTAVQGINDGLTYGLGEFGYWINEARSFQVGQGSGEDVQISFVLGKTLYAVTSSSIWWFSTSSRDMLDFQWFPAAQDVGCAASQSFVVLRDGAYWLGTIGGELEIIRWDGQIAMGRLRRRLRATLATLNSLSEATAVGFKGRYYLSYDSDGGGTNDRTLRYDLVTQGIETQAWGCGVFMDPYLSGSTPTLYCGAPTDVGHIYQVEGSAQNLGSDTTRLIESGDTHFQDAEHPPNWGFISFEVIVE